MSYEWLKVKTDWYEIEEFQPENDLPCEYVIEVRCRGWFRPNGEEPRFAADERNAPQARIVRWRKWENAPLFEEGIKLVREYRQKKVEEECNTQSN